MTEQIPLDKGDDASSDSPDPSDRSSVEDFVPASLATIREGEVLDIPQSERNELESKDEFPVSGRPQSPRVAEEDDDNESLLSLPAELPTPPDGGWGWVIVAASFLCNMIVDGVCYSFSPFMDEFSEYFNEPKGTVAWISSLLAGVYLSAGPIVSALSNKYGCRVVCISGALLSGTAYGLSVFATSVPYLMATQGVIAGFGFGLMYLPAVVMTGYYFESKRALATGIAVCGSGVGTMVFPPLMHHLIQTFGWQGTNLIIAGMILNGCWIGGLMRPLTVKKMKKKDLLHRMAEEKKMALEIGSFYGSNYMNVTNQDGTVIKKLKAGRSVNPDPGVHSHLNLSGYFTPTGTYNALPTITEGEVDAKPKAPLTQTDSRPRRSSGSDTSNLVPQTTKAMVVSGGTKKAVETRLHPIMSQPAMEPNGHQAPRVPPVGSVPNFNRRPSKIDMINHLKVVPASPQASYTNLRTLGSQDMRRGSTGYRRVTSAVSFSDNEKGIKSRRPSKEKRDIMLRPMSRQDIFYSGSIRNLQEFKSQSSILTYRESTLNIQGTGASKLVIDALDGVEPTEEKGRCCPDAVRGIFAQMLDVGLLKNPSFLLIGVANLIGMLGFYTPFVYLPAAAIEKGIDPDSATFLVSIIGITNTVGRVLSGLIADIPCVNALYVNNFCLIMSGVCVFVTPLATSYGAFVAIAVFFGFFVSAFIALTSIIVVDLLGVAQLTNAFGLLCVFRGFAGIISHPISGSIYDATKSYDVSFNVSGALLFLCAFLHCIVPCVQRCCSCYEGPVRYTTNEEYLQCIPEQDEDKNHGNVSPDAIEGAGIVLNIKPKDGRDDEDITEEITSAV